MRRILLIDDDPLVRRALVALLQRWGYEVEAAADGDAGLRVFRERGAHLVITDLTLTGITGIEVIVAVSYGPRPAPVIAMSGAATVELEHAKLVGASATLPKPFTTDHRNAAQANQNGVRCCSALRLRPRSAPRIARPSVVQTEPDSRSRNRSHSSGPNRSARASNQGEDAGGADITARGDIGGATGDSGGATDPSGTSCAPSGTGARSARRAPARWSYAGSLERFAGPLGDSVGPLDDFAGRHDESGRLLESFERPHTCFKRSLGSINEILGDVKRLHDAFQRLHDASMAVANAINASLGHFAAVHDASIALLACFKSLHGTVMTTLGPSNGRAIDFKPITRRSKRALAAIMRATTSSNGLLEDFIQLLG